ncbi:MAG: hypothetical protein CMJ90_01985 [Planctomycetes bacterium]|nr:hypothetical protein [Planctomycetota bacterium]
MQRQTRTSSIALLVALTGCVANDPAMEATPSPAAVPVKANVWAAGSTEKIERHRRAALPHDSVYDPSTRTVRLTAVRGEHAPFHLVVTTHGLPFPNVRVQMSPLSCDGHPLPAENCELFYEHLLDVYAPTGAHGRAGYWPDPLVPLTRPFTVPGTGRHDVPRNQPVWVDLFVPRDQRPGLYLGEVQVTCEGVSLGSVHVELTVVDVTLPEARNFPGHVGYYENHIARMHGLEPDSEAFRRVFKSYLELLFDYRLDPRTGPGMRGRVDGDRYVLEWPRPDLEKLFLDRDRLRIYVSPVPQGVERQSGHAPFTDAYLKLVRAHVEQVMAHARARGWLHKLGFWTPVDEPNTAEEYAAVRRWGDAIRAVDPDVPVAITEQPFTENPAWGSLVGHVNTWVINGNYLFEGEEQINARQQAGDRTIWYVSCDQLYPQPNYYIDREAADLRMVPWLTWRYGMSGFLYWTATYWEEIRDPWRDPITWKWFPCNSPAAGEGSLVYPGHLVERYTGQANVDGAVASLRLAMLREGLEELELIRLLAERDPVAADRIVRTICRHVRDFSRNPNVIDDARAAVIRALLNQR